MATLAIRGQKEAPPAAETVVPASEARLREKFEANRVRIASLDTREGSDDRIEISRLYAEQNRLQAEYHQIKQGLVASEPVPRVYEMERRSSKVSVKAASIAKSAPVPAVAVTHSSPKDTAAAPPIATTQDDGRLLTATDLAALMNCKVSWLWTHGKDLPFAIIPPGRTKVWRYSYAGFRKWQVLGSRD